MLLSRLLLPLILGTFATAFVSLISRRRIPSEGGRNRWRDRDTVINTPPRAAASALEQLKNQQREAKKRLQEETVQRSYHEHLDKLADGDADAVSKLGRVDKWEALSAGLTISADGYAPLARQPHVLGADDAAASRDRLHRHGYDMVTTERFDWATFGVDFAAIGKTMDNLVAAGWPPVFIFMYDEPWKVCARLFDLMAPLLADEELALEHSMYAWALQRPEGSLESAGKEKVGTVGFGTPHRDITYSNCHGSDGGPDILSLWIPVVDVDPHNGCMFVIPRESDPQFDKDVAKKDQDPFSHRFPYEAVTPLAPAAAGSALIWHPNLIHWGSACKTTSVLPPRKSIAMAFRVRDARRPSTEKEISRYGRAPMTRDEMLNGGPDLTQRIRMIAKAIQLYNVWYPLYEGFEIDLIDSSKN